MQRDTSLAATPARQTVIEKARIALAPSFALERVEAQRSTQRTPSTIEAREGFVNRVVQFNEVAKGSRDPKSTQRPFPTARLPHRRGWFRCKPHFGHEGTAKHLRPPRPTNTMCEVETGRTPWSLRRRTTWTSLNSPKSDCLCKSWKLSSSRVGLAC